MDSEELPLMGTKTVGPIGSPSPKPGTNLPTNYPSPQIPAFVQWRPFPVRSHGDFDIIVDLDKFLKLKKEADSGVALAEKILGLIHRWKKSPDDEFPLEDLSNEEQRAVVVLARTVLEK